MFTKKLNIKALPRRQDRKHSGLMCTQPMLKAGIQGNGYLPGQNMAALAVLFPLAHFKYSIRILRLRNTYKNKFIVKVK